MKLSKLIYHNGAVKIEVYEKGHRKRWKDVRIERKFLTKEKFVKPKSNVDWENMNLK